MSIMEEARRNYRRQRAERDALGAFEALRRQIIADLFMNFPHDTVEEALIAFPTTPKKTDLSWILNVRNVVAQLQEKATIGVEKDCRGAFFHFWVQRSVTSLQ